MINWSWISRPRGSLGLTGATEQQGCEQQDCERTHCAHGGTGLSLTVAASTIVISNIPRTPITICHADFWMNGTATSRMQMAKQIAKHCRSNCRVSRTLQLGQWMQLQRPICQTCQGMKRCPQTGQHLGWRDVFMRATMTSDSNC